MDENKVGDAIIAAAIQIHRVLGPGLLENVYEIVLVHELRQRGLTADRQVPVPVEYCGHKFDEGFRADLIVAGKVVVELKCVGRLNDAHRKQLMTYLRFTGMKLGYLLNFSQSLMTSGIVRMVHRLPEGVADF